MILLLGSKGQLGRAFCDLFYANNILFEKLSRDDFDLLNFDLLRNKIRELKPSLIINCAAYTDVNKAEKERDLAYKTNVELVRVICEEQRKHFGSVIHYSTDYVFDGKKKEPYLEEDIPVPVNYYGETKYLGELEVIKSGIPHLILRSGWIYSESSSSFVSKISSTLINKKQAHVVIDQVGTPNNADWIAYKTLEIIFNHLDDIYFFLKCKGGIYHLTSDGSTSWYDFAIKICKRLPKHKKEFYQINMLFSEDPIFSNIKRPKYSVLNNTKLKNTFGLKIENWLDIFNNSLLEYFDSIELPKREKPKKLILPFPLKKKKRRLAIN